MGGVAASGCTCTCAIHTPSEDESQKRLAFALSASAMGIWELDLRTNAVFWSEECFSIVGRRSFDGTLATFAESVHPDDLPQVLVAIERAVSARAPYSAEFRWMHSDGSWHWLANRGQAEYGEDGTPTRMFGTVQDVTAARRASDELRTSELRFRQLAESIDEVFWLTNVDYTEVLYVSPGYEAIWGKTVASLYESPGEWLAAIHPDDRVVIDTAGDKDSFPEYDHEYRIVRPNGEVRWIHDRGFPVRDERGHVIRVAGVAEDVTRRRELEAQLRHTQKMQSIGELAGGIAHDFNNILTIISTASDLLERTLPPEDEGRELVEEIRVAQQRASALTRQLLAFARRDVVEPQVIDLDDAVIDTEKMLRRLLGEDVVLTTVLRGEGQRVRIDPGQLAQVLMNLAVNARDAMPLGGHLRIETARTMTPPLGLNGPLPTNGYLVLSLTDTGDGMSEEAMNRAFEPFFTTKSVGEGTGMGLSVVHGIVEQSGGIISLRSEPGRGTTFTIVLPTVEAGAGGANAPAESAKGNAETVLVVEDDINVRRMVENALTRQGYHVFAAGGATEALSLLLQHRSNIVLLLTDVVMPGMDGRELAEEAVGIVPGLKVLYTSGYTDDLIMRRGVHQSAVSFLAKPYSIATLAERVRDVLSL